VPVTICPVKVVCPSRTSLNERSTVVSVNCTFNHASVKPVSSAVSDMHCVYFGLSSGGKIGLLLQLRLKNANCKMKSIIIKSWKDLKKEK
jgi:hypothetical protein